MTLGVDNSSTMRLEVTQRADLAVSALAETFNRLKRADLSSALFATPGIVPQAMGPLVRPRWVRSVPGPTGSGRCVVAASC